MTLTKPPTITKQNRNWIIHLYNIQGDISSCKKIIESEIEENDHLPLDVLKFKGINQRQRGQLTESLETFRNLVQIRPKSIENLRQLAISYFLLGKHKKASQIYETILKHEERGDIMINLAVCCKYMKEFEKGKDLVVGALQMGKSKEAFFLLGELLEMWGHVDKAGKAFKAADQLSCNESDISAKLGQIYFKSKNYPQAFEYFGRAVVAETNTTSLISLGAMLYANGSFDTAREKLVMASNAHEDVSVLWNNAGLCFLSQGKYQPAIFCLKKAHEISPLSWDIAYNCGLVEMTRGYYASAFHFLNASFALNSKSNLTLMLLAICLEIMGDRSNSSKAMNQCLKMEGIDWLVFFNSSILATLCGEDQKAEDLIVAAENLIEPNKAEILEKYPEIVGFEKIFQTNQNN